MSQLLIASDPKELVEAHVSLIASVQGKIEIALREAREAHEMVEKMTEARLSVSTAKLMHKRATSRVGYLIKMKAALESGYVMMPDIDGDIIAVRTAATKPSPTARRVRSGGWLSGATSQIPDERPQYLPASEGHYVSPGQTITHRHSKVMKDGSERDHYEAHAVALRDPDGLQRRFVRPEVVTRTAGAMALRIFDEIVTVRPANTQHRRSRDPIVLGRIIDKESKRCSAFLIAWFVEPATDI